MRFLITVLLLYFLPSYTFAQKPGAVVDVQSYRFDIELTDDNDTLRSVATIKLKSLTDADQFSLDLASLKPNGKGMNVDEVSLDASPLKFNHQNNKLSIISTLKKGNELTIRIKYHGIPSDGLIISKNKYQKRTFFSDNWPNRAQNWLPCVDHPSDKATVEFVVTAPEHYQVVSNGDMIEETNLVRHRKLTHWKESVAISTKIMVIGVADFAVQYSGKVDGTPIYAWIFPEDRFKGFHDFALANEILPYFNKNIAPYAFEKLANVQSKTIFGGMENAGAIFYAESLVDGKRTAEPTIVHEIAHQWFGDMATETDWPHLWLSEGFATYMTMLFMENKYGVDTLMHMMNQDRAQVVQFSKGTRRAVVDTTVTDYMKLLNANSYQKGSWILHMLRNEVGDQKFWTAIRAYYSKYAGKNANTEDARREFETASGKDFSRFFKQWLYTPGQPTIEAGWSFDRAKQSVKISVKQLQSDVFQFPLEIAVVTGTTITRKKINVTERETEFRFSSAVSPEVIRLDPDVKLLFDGKIIKN